MLSAEKEVLLLESLSSTTCKEAKAPRSNTLLVDESSPSLPSPNSDSRTNMFCCSCCPSFIVAAEAVSVSDIVDEAAIRNSVGSKDDDGAVDGVVVGGNGVGFSEADSTGNGSVSNTVASCCDESSVSPGVGTTEGSSVVCTCLKVGIEENVEIGEIVFR